MSAPLASRWRGVLFYSDPAGGCCIESMNPEQLLSLAAVMVGNGDVSLRDDPLTYAYRTLFPDQAPDTQAVDEAARYVSQALRVPHSPDGWWLQLAGRDTTRIASLLAHAATLAKPKELEP